MFDLGFQELVVIFAVAIIVFGPKRLPELSRTLGRGIGHLKKALFDVKYEINKEMRILDEEAGVKPEDNMPEWKKQALESIYGGREPGSGGVQGPGDAAVNPPAEDDSHEEGGTPGGTGETTGDAPEEGGKEDGGGQ